MNAEGWSAIAAGCSAVAATVSLFVTWHAKRIQGRSADFANCIQMAEQLRDMQRFVRDECEKDNNEARYEFELRELINLLEVLALLHNDNRIAASAKKFTGKFLDEVLAWINVDPGMAEFMRKSKTGEDTYRELKRFESRRKNEIGKLSRFYWRKREIQR